MYSVSRKLNIHQNRISMLRAQNANKTKIKELILKNSIERITQGIDKKA